MDIIELKKKQHKLEIDLFDLVYQFIIETETSPSEINFEWAETRTVGEKHFDRQLIDCIVKLEI